MTSVARTRTSSATTQSEPKWPVNDYVNDYVTYDGDITAKVFVSDAKAAEKIAESSIGGVGSPLESLLAAPVAAGGTCHGESAVRRGVHRMDAHADHHAGEPAL